MTTVPQDVPFVPVKPHPFYGFAYCTRTGSYVRGELRYVKACGHRDSYYVYRRAGNVLIGLVQAPLGSPVLALPGRYAAVPKGAGFGLEQQLCCQVVVV
jgi:hypothetical protein